MEKKHKIRTGRVVSNNMDKTIVVTVETLRRHPLYKKTIKRVVRYMAHDENNECKLGDVVRIIECRPLSGQKHWRMTEILAKGEVAEIQPREIT